MYLVLLPGCAPLLPQSPDPLAVPVAAIVGLDLECCVSAVLWGENQPHNAMKSWNQVGKTNVHRTEMMCAWDRRKVQQILTETAHFSRKKYENQ